MKRHWVSGLIASMSALGSVLSGAAPTDARVPASSPLIRYEGRFAADETGAVQLGYPGVTVQVRYHGSRLVLHAQAPNNAVWFDVMIDDGAPTVLHLREGEGDYELVPAGAAAGHTVTLIRRTESWRGVCSLIAFEAGSGGEILPPAPAPARKLMFIGDSVTCGELTALNPVRAITDAENSNARLSYGMILARRLGAQCHLVSYGGRGIIRDWQGIRDTNNAPQFYELALPDDRKALWDHRRYVPDVIGIQLGTNDFNQGVPDQNEFVNAYVEFVRKVRRDAPEARVLLMDSPIVNDDAVHGPRRTVLHGYLEQIVRRLDTPKVILAPVSHYPGVPANGHPTGAEHIAIADELEPLFRQALAGR